MAYQAIFKRYELKYLLTSEQKKIVLAAMEPHMALDQYGRTTIRSLYFDTDNYRLIRNSISKPAYKEKLRLRSYAQASLDSAVFVELKKKYRSVVYKRRVAMPEKDAMAWLCGERPCPVQGQIPAEIDYVLDFYKTLRPAMFLSYEREAFYAIDGSGFRVTFDDTILCRREALSLESEVYGTPILPEGLVLMELKCAGGIPLWMTRVLTENHIYKSSFSKYGTAYKILIHAKRLEVSHHD
ncbi:MAG: polyphosphate polymerase domain-containing protein [Ruminococcaceae bacterium]|nr:polyphosphate polymerase domain-containing protein [Oscillospiraceae bacterium]